MKGQILIIDDNAVDIKIATAALEKIGFACIGFVDYKQALDWLLDSKPQIILLDLQMPEISGFELIPTLRKNAQLKNIPLIIISGKNQSQDINKAIQLGANDYIIKPIDPLVIQEKVLKIDENTKSEFHSVDVSNLPYANGFFSKEFKILSLSEFGITVESNFNIKPNETIEAIGLSPQLTGIEKIMIRCLNITNSARENYFNIQFTFVGMKEAQRQFIRKLTRQIWIQSRKASS